MTDKHTMYATDTSTANTWPGVYVYCPTSSLEIRPRALAASRQLMGPREIEVCRATGEEEFFERCYTSISNPSGLRALFFCDRILNIRQF